MGFFASIIDPIKTSQHNYSSFKIQMNASVFCFRGRKYIWKENVLRGDTKNKSDTGSNSSNVNIFQVPVDDGFPCTFKTSNRHKKQRVALNRIESNSIFCNSIMWYKELLGSISDIEMKTGILKSSAIFILCQKPMYVF
jgi:hypothetical protein